MTSFLNGTLIQCAIPPLRIAGFALICCLTVGQAEEKPLPMHQESTQSAPVVGVETEELSVGVSEYPTSGYRASRLLNAEIFNEGGEKIGKVDDLIIDAKAAVDMAILSVGGFLRIGARLAAVPVSSIQIDQQGRLILPGGTKEELLKLPEFTYKR